MSNPYVRCAMLFLAGGVIGSLPFIAELRTLPRWIRVAQCLIGITSIAGSMLLFTLYSAGSRISESLHRFLFFHVVMLAGMGFGVLVLVLISGEYFKALRALDAARRERLAAKAQASASESV